MGDLARRGALSSSRPLFSDVRANLLAFTVHARADKDVESSSLLRSSASTPAQIDGLQALAVCVLVAEGTREYSICVHTM